MFKEFSEKLKHAVYHHKPFVLLRKPNESEIILMVHEEASKNRFIMHSFDNKKELSICDDQSLQIQSTDFDFHFVPELNFSEDFEPIKKEKYEELIQYTISKIKNSSIQKIVLSRVKLIENYGYDVLQSFKKLVSEHPSAFVYFVYHSEDDTWLGASPELLLSRKKNEIKSVSLAGTKLHNEKWTGKELEEQRMVTEYIAKQLSGFGSLDMEGPETVQAGRMEHLKTYFHGEVVADLDTNDILMNLHPTPAVCGFPKEEAYHFIIENEGYNRGFYSGYLGLESNDEQMYFVNLRCAQLFRDKIWLYVGGGITGDSSPENEWIETEIKSGTIKNALN